MLPGYNDERVGKVLLWGLILLVSSMFCIPLGIIFARGIGGVIGVLMFVVGLGMTGYSVFSGLSKTRNAAKGEARSLPECQVLARFGTNSLGETIFDAEYLDLDDPKTKLYVRLVIPSGQRFELRTSPEVWLQVGEGAKGRAIFQGEWLSQFVPFAPPTAPTGNPYDR